MSADDREYGASTPEEFAAMPEVGRLRSAIERWYDMGHPCEQWASAGFPNASGVQCGDYRVSDNHTPCLPCWLMWDRGRYDEREETGASDE